MNTTPTPPGLSDVRWSRLIDVCRQMDDRANRGAGPPRPDHDGPCIPWAGKPVLTWGIAVEHTSGSATMGPPKRVFPALRQQPGNRPTPDRRG